MATFNETEREAIILNAVWGIINDMVNYGIFERFTRNSDVVLIFPKATHMRLFNILLADFLSLPHPRRNDPVPFNLPEPPSNAAPSDLTHLFYLKQLCADPKLGKDTIAIKRVVDEFSGWLESEAVVKKVWLPTIDTELDMKIGRIQFLKICGDIAKHNFTRLSQNVKRIQRILDAHGVQIDESQAYLVLPEFYEWFHTNIFACLASTIAEFLNNLRLEIFTYLEPEFARAYHSVEPEPRYRYHIPTAITQPLAKGMYWELMNMVRARPYMQRFAVSPHLKKLY